VLGVACKAEEGAVGLILALAVEVDEVVGVYGVRLRGIAFIESGAVPHP
jgi:hypothetical protein